MPNILYPSWRLYRCWQLENWRFRWHGKKTLLWYLQKGKNENPKFNLIPSNMSKHINATVDLLKTCIICFTYNMGANFEHSLAHTKFSAGHKFWAKLLLTEPKPKRMWVFFACLKHDWETLLSWYFQDLCIVIIEISQHENLL